MSLIGPMVVLALLLGVVAISRLAAAEPAPELELRVSDDAPGMILVMLDPDEQPPPGQYYRIRWWEGDAASGELIGSVVLDAPGRDSQGPVAITGLDDTTYAVQVDIVERSGDGFDVVDGTTSTATASVTVPAVDEPCGTITHSGNDLDISACARLVDDQPDPIGNQFFASFFTGTTSTQAVTTADGVGLIDRRYEGFWPNDTADDQSLGAAAWTRFRLVAADLDAEYAVHWWSGFEGFAGRSAETAVEFLVPHGGSVNLGDVALEPGTKLSGEIMKSDGAGGALALEPEDIVSPCTLILRVDSGSTEYVNEVCGFDGQPALGEGQGGKWQVALLPGEYVVRIFDRANYFGGDDILNYNVRFASEWWRSDGGRGENQAQASVITVDDEAVDLGPRVLRDAEQLRIDITDIPEQILEDNPLIERNEELVESINARISVTDEFGNWFGGAMEIDRLNRTAKASVTGLVADRPYRVFVSFNGEGVNRFWLVGGGTLVDAMPIVPQGGATAIEESWQLPQIIVSLHREDGTPYGPDEACVFLRSVDDAAAPRSASACTVQFRGADGVILLQRVPEGIYEAVAYRRSGNNSIGPPVIIRNFELDDEAETIDLGTEFTTGLSDVSGLTAPSLPFPYSPDRAIVIPVEGN